MRTLLLLLAVAVFSCDRTRIGMAVPPDTRVDTYPQTAAQKIDVLWVVDNSGSMAPRQDNLARNFQAFISAFTQNAIDYRIAVTSTDIFRDRGRFLGNPAVVSPMTGNPVTAFAANVRVGISGSPYEAGLESARLAIEKQKAENQMLVETCKARCAAGAMQRACQGDCEAKTTFPFLRDDAYLYIIFITDEEDRSEQDVRYYYRYFETAKGIGNDGLVTTAAIMGDVPTNACNATPGTRYSDLSRLTGGEVGSICDTNFSATLRKLANNAIGLRRKFSLQLPPNPRTIEVKVRYPCNFADADSLGACASVDRSACMGAPVDSMNLVCATRQGGADGWSYEAMNNAVFFAGASVPALKGIVELRYYEEGKEP